MIAVARSQGIAAAVFDDGPEVPAVRIENVPLRRTFLVVELVNPVWGAVCACELVER